MTTAAAGAPTSAASLVRRHKHLWELVTRNPFIDGIREGTLPRRLFDRWLVQDRFYVEALFPTAARVLAAAPIDERRGLLEVLVSTQKVVDRFEVLEKSRRLPRAREIHPVCRAYVDHIKALALEPFPVAVTSLWAQDRAFLDAWKSARPGGDGYRSIVAAWTSAEVDARCKLLQGIADRALRGAGPAVRAAAEHAFEQVVRYELDFWVMALEPD